VFDFNVAQVLYLPPLGVSDVNEAARDKELVQQLESIVIYWTRQIKEVRGGDGLYILFGSQG
jgi:dynein heavy chain